MILSYSLNIHVVPNHTIHVLGVWILFYLLTGYKGGAKLLCPPSAHLDFFSKTLEYVMIFWSNNWCISYILVSTWLRINHFTPKFSKFSGGGPPDPLMKTGQYSACLTSNPNLWIHLWIRNKSPHIDCVFCNFNVCPSPTTNVYNRDQNLHKKTLPVGKY